jgi:hypothetical protein
MTLSVSWTHCTQFYVSIRSIGETEFIFALLLAHFTRYLILNFGNVAELDFNMW